MVPLFLYSCLELLRSIIRSEKLLSPPSKVMLGPLLADFLDVCRVQLCFSRSFVLVKARLARRCSDRDNIFSNAPAQQYY